MEDGRTCVLGLELVAGQISGRAESTSHSPTRAFVATSRLSGRVTAQQEIAPLCVRSGLATTLSEIVGVFKSRSICIQMALRESNHATVSWHPTPRGLKMCRRPSSKLLEVLLTTIEQLEKDTDFGPGDPTVTDLKRILVLRLAELEGAPMDTSSQIGEFAASESPLESDQLTILRMR